MNRWFTQVTISILPVLILGALAVAQQINETKAPARANSELKIVQPSPVTINMPEGMTKDQADAILNELRQIRQLLEKQPSLAAAAAPPAAPPPPSDKVTMTVGQGWYSMGRDDAPVTMVEFADYQCPFCRRFHTDAFVDLKKNYIDTGKVRFVSRDLPLDFHENAPRAAEAARCAGDQGKYWEMRDALITNATDLGADAVARYAQSLSLDMMAFRTCVISENHKTEIQKDLSDAGALQISGTPTFVLARTAKDRLNGVRLVGAQPYSSFDAAIRQVLAAP